MVDVLIAGAGPTGLALAAQIQAQGASVRIVERRLERRHDSPALIVQPRTLEVLEPTGLASRLLERGNRAGNVQIHHRGRTTAVRLPAPIIANTAYPHLLMIPQWEVEAVIEEYLQAAGVTVERGKNLLSFAQGAQGVECVLGTPDGTCERAHARYLVGCDGSDSVVRRIAGIPFPVSAYRASAVLSDLGAGTELSHDFMHVFVERSGILFLFPLPEPASWRLLVARRLEGRDGDSRPTLGPDALAEVVRGFPVESLGLRDPQWLTEIPLRRGQALSYRQDRVFLAGDAAHVHSPAGGQGMNTGIQDAVNLGWKLALVARGIASRDLLDSYDAERWPVARWTRRLTDPAFAAETSDSAFMGVLRRYAAGLMAPAARWNAPARAALPVIGGLLIRYRHSPAVADAGRRRGYIRAGDRLPNARINRAGGAGWLHESLRGPGLHLLLLGPSTSWSSRRLGVLMDRFDGVVTAHHFDETEALSKAGLKGPAQYLVRPDGYVAFVSPGLELSPLEAYLDRWLPGSPLPSERSPLGRVG